MSIQYFTKVKENCVSEIAISAPGQRNEILNKAAFSIGRHSHFEGVDVDAALLDISTAAKAIGLNDIEIKSTMGSGFSRGLQSPKELTGSEQAPYEASEMTKLIQRLVKKNIIENDAESRKDKITKAQAIWDSCIEISPKNKDAVRPALLYLNSRAINARTATKSAKFSPNVYGGPALIFPALDINGDITGVQSVLIDVEGKKRTHKDVSKYSRGVISGSSMHAKFNTELPFILTEGPEDALSVMQVVGKAANVVCTFGKAGMSTFVAPRKSHIIICADPDLNVEKTSENLKYSNDITIASVAFGKLDPETLDANDYLMKFGSDKLNEAIQNAELIKVPDISNPVDLSDSDWPTEYTMFNEMLLPRRRWVYDKHYLRSFVSVLASAGGVGKTSLQIVEALAICTGKNLLGEEVHEQSNVWIVNLEDPIEEMQRKILAAMGHYNIKPEEIRGRLFLDAGRDFQLSFATQTRDGVIPNQALVEHLIQEIPRRDIGMVFIDPFVGSHSVSENDNVAINTVLTQIRRVADETSCAIGLVHHIRKGNGEEANVDSVRGAGSLIGAARAARVINKISSEEAMKLGVQEEDSLGIFRCDDGKANLAPPSNKAVYRKMIGCKIANGEYVGVATPYKLPDLFDGITTRNAMEVQQLVDTAAQTEPFRASSQAKHWVGSAVAEVLKLDIKKRADKSRISAILKQWISTNVLKNEQYLAKRQGREVEVIFVGEWINVSEAGG